MFGRECQFYFVARTPTKAARQKSSTSLLQAMPTARAWWRGPSSRTATPGQFVTGDVVVADVTVPVAVNPAALQELQGKTVVFIHDAKGFAPRPVQVGRRSREAVEITEGVTAGERYAAANSYLIKADLLKGEAEED